MTFTEGRRRVPALFPEVDEDPPLVADHDIGAFVAVEVRREDFGADPTVVVDEVRGEAGVSVRPFQLEPPHHVRRVRLRIAGGAMGLQFTCRRHH